MRRFAADLHIHTALSPCAFGEMEPGAIVQTALDRGLALIAVCDHNAAGNVDAVRQAAQGHLTVLPGVEIATREEVHVLGLFETPAQALRVAAVVAETLPMTSGEPRPGEEQRLLDAEGRVIGLEPRALSAASTLSLEDVSALIRSQAGLCVAAHVDRPSFSVFSQLGLFPPGGLFDAVEVSAAGYRHGRAAEFAPLGLPIFASSDSHFLSDIGCCRTLFEMEAPEFAEVVMACKGVDGRRCTLA